MSAIVRKALLIKNPSNKKSDVVKNNFAVVKCESAAGRTFFELPDIVNDGADCDLIVYDDENMVFLTLKEKKDMILTESSTHRTVFAPRLRTDRREISCFSEIL